MRRERNSSGKVEVEDEVLVKKFQAKRTSGERQEAVLKSVTIQQDLLIVDSKRDHHFPGGDKKPSL
jgi:hypothetical protein